MDTKAEAEVEIETKTEAATFKSIAAEQFMQQDKQGMVQDVIDVRSPEEFNKQHLANARNVPLDQIDPEKFAEQIKEKGLTDGRGLYIVCLTGKRATQAAQKLHTLLPELHVVLGGTAACITHGMPLISDDSKKTGFSLEQQVLMSAGTLVLISLLVIGSWSHILGNICLIAIGCGLIYAGITNTCYLAKLLKRMPWNK